MAKETQGAKSVQPHQLKSQMQPKLLLLIWKILKKRNELQPITLKEINNKANLPQSQENSNELTGMLKSISSPYCSKKKSTKGVEVESRASTRAT